MIDILKLIPDFPRGFLLGLGADDFLFPFPLFPHALVKALPPQHLLLIGGITRHAVFLDNFRNQSSSNLRNIIWSHKRVKSAAKFSDLHLILLLVSWTTKMYWKKCNVSSNKLTIFIKKKKINLLPKLDLSEEHSNIWNGTLHMQSNGKNKVPLFFFSKNLTWNYG